VASPQRSCRGAAEPLRGQFGRRSGLDTLPDSKNPDLSIRDDYFADTHHPYCLVELNDKSALHFKNNRALRSVRMDANCCVDATMAKKGLINQIEIRRRN
jgi:hypothetical protein